MVSKISYKMIILYWIFDHSKSNSNNNLKNFTFRSLEFCACLPLYAYPGKVYWNYNFRIPQVGRHPQKKNPGEVTLCITIFFYSKLSSINCNTVGYTNLWGPLWLNVESCFVHSFFEPHFTYMTAKRRQRWG